MYLTKYNLWHISLLRLSAPECHPHGYFTSKEYKRRPRWHD